MTAQNLLKPIRYARVARRGPHRFALWLTVATQALVGGTVLSFAPAQLLAQSQTQRSFDIPAQSLSSALAQFGRQSGTQVAFASSVTSGLTSRAVSGTMPPEQALTLLLNGTGILWHNSGAGFVIEKPDFGAQMGLSLGEDVMVLDTIVVDAGSWGALGDSDRKYQVPASVDYIPEEDIQWFRGSSAGDFLKGTPGVMTGDNRNSGAVDVNIRGMQGFGRVPVVIDGTRQQNTVYRGYSGVANRNYVDPDLISDVTIDKGPSAGVYGVGATGGVVEMQTIGAEDILKEGETYGFRVRGGFATNSSAPPAEGTRGGIYGFETQRYRTGCSYDCAVQDVPEGLDDVNSYGTLDGMDRPSAFEPTSTNGSVAAAKAWEDLEFAREIELVGAYSRRKTGNYYAGTNGDTPTIEYSDVRLDLSGDRWVDYTYVTLEGLNRYRAGEEVLNTSQDNTSYMLKGSLETFNGQRFELGYMRYESLFGELMPSVIIRGEGAEQAPLSEVSVDTYTARYKWDRDDLINLSANLWHTHTDTLIRTPYEFFGGEFDQGYWDISKRTGFDITNESTLRTGMGEVALSYGASYTYETLAPPDDYDAKSSEVSDILQSRDGWRREASAFVAAEWGPLDWLTLNGSLRYTHTHSYDNNPAQIVGTDSYENNEEKNSGFAPIAAITVEPVGGYQLYLRYAEAIRAPSLFESSGGWSFESSPSLALKAEHAKNWELGTNIMLDDVLGAGDSLRFKAAYFHNRTDDYLTRVYYSGSDTETGTGSTAMRNIDYAEWKGFEVSAAYDTGRFFAEASATHYTHMNFCTKETTGSQADRCRPGGVSNGYAQLHVTPETSATLTLGGRFFDETLTLGARTSYVGARASGTSSEDSGYYTNIVEWAPYTLVDLFGSYELNDSTSVDFSVDNLTDVYYMDALTLGLMPSPGRTIRASITAKF